MWLEYSIGSGRKPGFDKKLFSIINKLSFARYPTLLE